MTWARKKQRTGKYKEYSLLQKLRREAKLNDSTEVAIGNLTLEELIGVKLELAARTINGKLYGIPIWRNLPNIAKDAALKYAISSTRSQQEAARFLGIRVRELKKIAYKFKTERYFTD